MNFDEFARLFAILCCLLLFSEAQIFRCGIRQETQNLRRRRKRVIGGDEAPENSWPWIVNFIDHDNLQQCAGSIIDREWILTAGHCFLFEKTPYPLANYSYHVADHRLNFNDTYEYEIAPSHLYVHPGFILGNNDIPGDYDIALLKLAKPLNFSVQVRPVCLPNAQTKFTVNDTCYLAGWGNNISKSGYHRSPVLKEARLDLVPLERCNSNVSYGGIIPARFFCAGREGGGVDGCLGDSGGPYQCERNGTWTQMGIMIWGKGCAQPNLFGVYTDVQRFLPFIRAIQAGPNPDLTRYYEKTLLETLPNVTERDWKNLHVLFTRQSNFSDVDLVRNLVLLPKQIQLLRNTTLSDLVFASERNNLLENSTTLRNITKIFVEQANRLNIYVESKSITKEQNITFEELLRMFNLTKNDLLNSNSELDNVRKAFVVKGHWRQLRLYKKTLLTYNDKITFNDSNITEYFSRISLEKVKKLDKKMLKQILVKGNEKVFTEMITVRNISAFFEHELAQLKNRSVIGVLTEVLNVSREDFGSLHHFTGQQLDVVAEAKISAVSNSQDLSLYEVTKAILQARSFTCGVRHEIQTSRTRRKRVVGGNEAPKNSWPWIVNFIDHDNLQQCAGSIIDREWILTAGHCFLFEKTPYPLANYSYHVADHRLNFNDTYEYEIAPSHLYVHPGFILGNNDIPGDYDIALLKLAKPLNFSVQVRPVCLPDAQTKFTVNDTCYLAGWGNNISKSGYHRSPVLKEARLDLVPLEQCNSNVSYGGIIPARFFCAGREGGGVDGCFGDSGGPYQCERNGTWTQMGIMIWGKGCAQPNLFGVYTDVQRFLPFIRAIQAGPNANLSAYYQRKLVEAQPDAAERNFTNLYKLLTKDSNFSDVDLVRNLMLVPDQIKLLRNTTLMDLVFVSYRNNLVANTTTLKNVTRVFLEQTPRLNIHVQSKEIVRELNITFEEMLRISNKTKDELLDSDTSILVRIRKTFYINGHIRKLVQYKEMLLSYNRTLSIVFDMQKSREDFYRRSLDEIKKVNDTSLKLLLVEQNKLVFVGSLALRNISAFFEVSPEILRNKTVTEVSAEILNISLGEFASLHHSRLTAQQLDVLRGIKISSILNVTDEDSLFGITDALLDSREINECNEEGRCSKYARCFNSIGSYSCRCQKGYVGDGFNCLTGNRIFSSVMRLNESFLPALQSPDSYEYVTLARKIENGVSQAVRVFGGFTGFLGTQVTDIKQGSVLVVYVLVFALGERDHVNVSKLGDVINAAINNGSVVASAVNSTSLQQSDLCQLGSNNCHRDATCDAQNGHFACICNKGFQGDGVNCTDPCRMYDCLDSNSHCYAGLDGKVQCICNEDYAKTEDGKCEENNDFKVPLIVVSCVAGVLFLLLMFICCRKYCREQNKKIYEMNDREESGARSNTGFDDMNMKRL